MAKSRPECEIGKMTESGTEDMDWEEMEDVREAEEKKREEEEEKSKKNVNVFMDQDERTSEEKLRETGQDGQKGEFSAENERQHERKHIVGVTVSDGAKRRKTLSAGQAKTSGDEDAKANEIDLQYTFPFVETSTKKEKNVKTNENFLGKQKPTTQLKLSQTKLNFKKMDEFNETIDKQGELQSEKVIFKDKDGKSEVSEETKDEEIKGKVMDEDEKSEISSEPSTNSSEMMKEDELREIEGETNKWLDDLDEWELKVVAKFKEVNMMEGKTSLENHMIDRKMNTLLRSVHYEANSVKKALYSGGKNNELDSTYMQSYIAWYQQHDEDYLFWKELEEMEDEELTKEFMYMVQPTEVVTEDGEVKHIARKILSPREIEAIKWREHSGPVVRKKALKYCIDEYKRCWKNVEVETNAAMMAQGISKLAGKVDLVNTTIDKLAHVEKISVAYWKQNFEGMEYKQHSVFEYMKMEKLVQLLKEREHNSPLNDENEPRDMEIDYLNNTKKKEEITPNDVKMIDKQVEDVLKEKTKARKSSGKERVANQKNIRGF